MSSLSIIDKESSVASGPVHVFETYDGNYATVSKVTAMSYVSDGSWLYAYRLQRQTNYCLPVGSYGWLIV